MPGVPISNLGEERNAYSKGTLRRGGGVVNFSQIVAWHDHFFNTLFAWKQQHKLCIDIKSFCESIIRSTINTYCVHLMSSQTETMYKS